MSTIQRTVSCSKELTELGDGVAKFLKILKEESKDGFDVGDISAILASAMTDLLPAMEGVSEISREAAEDREAFVNASALCGAQIITAVM